MNSDDAPSGPTVRPTAKGRRRPLFGPAPRFREVALFAVVALALILALALLLDLYGRLLGGLAPTNPGLFLAQSLGVLLALYLVVLRPRRIGLRAFGLRPIPWIWVPVCILVVMLDATLLALFQQVFVETGAPSLVQIQERSLELSGSIQGTTLEALVTVLAVGLLVPLAEELVFRGLLFTWLYIRFGLAVAVLGSALLFGLAHLDANVGWLFLPPFMLSGVFLALLAWASRSLTAPLLAHVLRNLMAVIWPLIGGPMPPGF